MDPENSVILKLAGMMVAAAIVAPEDIVVPNGDRAGSSKQNRTHTSRDSQAVVVLTVGTGLPLLFARLCVG